jgi:hypothetical protein
MHAFQVIYVACKRHMAGAWPWREILGVTCLGYADVDKCLLLRLAGAARLVVASLAERVAQPFKTLIQTVTRCGASGLDVLEAMLARR